MTKQKSEYGEYLEFAIRLAEGAGEILMKGFGNREYNEKSETELITKTDLKSEKFITDSIKRRYSAHQILSEEVGSNKTKSDFLWIVDPLDGTHNFIFGLPFFGVSIALAYKGRVVVGVVHIPAARQTYHAEKGMGALLNGKEIHVSKRSKEPGKASVFSFDGPSIKKENYPEFSKIQDLLFKARNFGASSVELGFIASGLLDAGVWFGAHPWDVAAGLLIIEEAVGKITDFSGKEWGYGMKKIIASNGLVHESILKALNSK
jgi:myo-inositol-1(or 4)-monophosphatase